MNHIERAKEDIYECASALCKMLYDHSRYQPHEWAWQVRQKSLDWFKDAAEKHRRWPAYREAERAALDRD